MKRHTATAGAAGKLANTLEIGLSRAVNYSVFVGGIFGRLDAALREGDLRFDVLFVRGLRTADGEGR